jgi:DNA processing protein
MSGAPVDPQPSGPLPDVTLPRSAAATEEDRRARLALHRLAEPGDPRLAGLVAELGASTVRDHLVSERDLRGLATDVAGRLAEIDPTRDLEIADRRGFRYVVPGDPDWPARLDDLGHAEPLHRRGGPPLGLWVRGTSGLEALTASVAVVGSRSATTYGASVAGEIAAGLSRENITVVSGAAFGIDQAAHRGALGGQGRTVAVLACGVDRVYPQAHRALIDHIADTGLVVSESPPGWAPTRLRFLSRNRLIAGLTVGTVVVEAALRSGALNTANWAARLHRVVMGVPGPVTSAPSQGVHELIRSGAATLVTESRDVLELVGGAGEHLGAQRRGAARPRDALTARHAQVLDAVPVALPAAVDSVARTAGLGLVEVRAALDRLRSLGLVEELPAGWRLAPEVST